MEGATDKRTAESPHCAAGGRETESCAGLSTSWQDEVAPFWSQELGHKSWVTRVSEESRCARRRKFDCFKLPRYNGEDLK
eukprot:1371981-Prymnesium_polylepis.1